MDEMREALSWRRMALNLLAAYGANWSWVTVSLCLIGGLLGVPLLPHALPFFSVSVSILSELGALEFFAAYPSLLLFIVLFMAPIVEEAVFRMLPLTIVRNKRPDLAPTVVFLVCGMLFGLAHGSTMSVMIQGVGGMILGYLYLTSSRNQLTSYFSCVIVHAMFNFTVMMAAGG